MHSRELLRLYKRLNPQGSRGKVPAVPRVITLFQKCVEHQIQDSLIRRLHFNDLYVLILSLDIANVKQALRQQSRSQERRAGRDVRDISQNDAVKFLKGGG